MDLGLPTNGARDAGKHLRTWRVSSMRRGLLTHELRNCTPGGDGGSEKMPQYVKRRLKIPPFADPKFPSLLKTSTRIVPTA
jgi:hypothetical protein